MTTDPAAPTTRKPERGEELDLRVDALAFGGNGVARLQLGERGYVVFVQGAIPGDRVRAVVTKRKRDYAEARTLEVLEPGPGPHRTRRRPSRRALADPAVRAPAARSSRSRSATRCGAWAGSRASSSSRSSPRSSSGATATSSSTRSAPGTTAELVCGFHAPGSWERILHIDDCLLASERGNELRRRALDACREQGLSAYDRRTQVGFLRNLVVREGRRTGQEQVRLVTSPGRLRRRGVRRRARRGAERHLDAGRGRRRDDAGRARRADLRHAADRGGARRPALRAQLRGVLPDEHRDGRGALRRRRRVRRARRLRARLRPLLRHRHDRPDARIARRRGARASRSSPRRSRTPRTTPASTRSPTRASSPATSASS